MKQYIFPATKQDVIKEYSESSHCTSSYQRAKWGSEEKMLFRFKLLEKKVDWSLVAKWLDVGCGDCSLFETVKRRNVETYGLDMVPKALSHAKLGKKRLLCSDAEYLAIRDESLDLVSMIGVLQKCGGSPRSIFLEIFRILGDKGQIFFTTKNITWEEFSKPDVKPYKGHSWYNPADLLNQLSDIGFDIKNAEGFIPGEKR
ncbi:MAG: class I SAM-dependent methyltransferase, partial [Candidatus Brocadiales bacterium]|nr:class I SAM-dependent methyltransferase [Candidatus Brocadiales bacterium]